MSHLQTVNILKPLGCQKLFLRICTDISGKKHLKISKRQLHHHSFLIHIFSCGIFLRPQNRKRYFAARQFIPFSCCHDLNSGCFCCLCKLPPCIWSFRPGRQDQISGPDGCKTFSHIFQKLLHTVDMILICMGNKNPIQPGNPLAFQCRQKAVSSKIRLAAASSVDQKMMILRGLHKNTVPLSYIQADHLQTSCWMISQYQDSDCQKNTGCYPDSI